MKDIITICNYCGCSGEAYLHVTNERVAGSDPGKSHPISRGYRCSTDWHPHEFTHSSKRLTASALKSAEAFTVTSKERKYGCC